MEQLIELEKYLKDFIDMQDNDIVKLTLTIVLQKVHRMMDKYMKDIEKEQAYYTGYEDGREFSKGVSNNE